MASPNVGLKNDIDPSDYLDPTVFNNNFNLIDKLGLDPITESGKSGEWWYRKYRSGRYECGVDSKQFAESALHGWGGSGSGLYATNQYTFGAYPFNFSARPNAVVTFQNDANNASRGSIIVMFNTTSTSMSPSFEVVDPLNINMKPLCGIVVYGIYK